VALFRASLLQPLLHDAVEDQGVKPETIASEFGPQVAEIVVEVTDDRCPVCSFRMASLPDPGRISVPSLALVNPKLVKCRLILRFSFASAVNALATVAAFIEVSGHWTPN
jgi:hypothetical protein